MPEGLATEETFLQAGFPTGAEQQLKDILHQLQASGYVSVAIRSSANKEDSLGHSFAGQFESYLNIRHVDDAVVAIKKCWASLYGEKVLAYCRNKHLPHADIKLSVIIQGMVDSASSGVVFTANPLTGKDTQMVIEAVKGLGEALVQGSVMPDMYASDWYQNKIEIKRSGEQHQYLQYANLGSGLEWKQLQAEEPVLNESQISALTSECLKVQAYYGQPLDIEWAFANGNFFILQARPLTSIQFDTENDWTNADLKDGGISSSITTPMMYSLYEFIFESTMPAYFKELHIFPKKPFKKWFSSWFGYSYWNMEAAKEGAKQIPGFIERNFDRSLGIEPDYEGKGHVTRFTPASILRGIRILLATNNSIRQRESVCRQTIVNIDVYFKELDAMEQQQMDTGALLKQFDDMVRNKYLLMEGMYFYTIYDNSNAATFCQEAVDKLNKKSSKKIQYLNLVAGLSNLSHLRPSYELWELSRKLRKDQNAVTYYTQHTVDDISRQVLSDLDFPFKAEVWQFIQKYAHHSLRELDLTVPNWDEDPAQAIDMLKAFLKMEDDMSPLEHNKKQVDIFHKELSGIKNKGLHKKVETHRQLLWWREEMRDHSSRFYARLRKILLLIGQRLQAEGKFSQADDVFFLEFGQLLKMETFNYKDIIKKNRMFHQSFRHFNKPNEILRKQGGSINKQELDVNGLYHGIAGSGGIISGRAVNIESIYEADSINEGDILVTKFTDPAWTPYFSRIAGLVTETGGMLSHGAVVSREYGNPAVLAVKQACAIIRSGDIIEVDGYAGTVKMIKKA